MLFIILSLLYLGQLIYIGNRWLNETATVMEASRMTRMRNAIDWTDKPQAGQMRRGLRR